MKTYRVEVSNAGMSLVFDVCIVRAENCAEAESKSLAFYAKKYELGELSVTKIEELSGEFVK